MAKSSASVEEVPSNEEHYFSMNSPEPEEIKNDDGSKVEMYEISDRLMPQALANIPSFNNLLTTNWKENAYEMSNSVPKQLISFALIMGYFFLGGSAVESGAMVPLGAVTLGYATSSLVGYFGLANAPFAKLMRVNAVSVLCAIMALCSLFSSGMDIHIALLAVMHLFDAYQGAI